MRWFSDPRRALAAVVLTALSAPAAPAGAQTVVSTGQSFVQGEILPGSRQADGTRLAGLGLTLAGGWKTYWRSPGEAGVPPNLDWSASRNVERVEVLWPRPELFTSFGLQTVGYRGRAVLPLRVTPKDPAMPMELALSANLGVCKEMCVMESFTLSRSIPAGLGPEGEAEIARAAALVPPSGGEAGLEAATCRVTGAGKDRQLELKLAFQGALERPVVLVEGTDEIWVTRVESTQPTAGAMDVSAGLRLLSTGTWIDRAAFRITVLADNLSADVRGCTAPAG